MLPSISLQRPIALYLPSLNGGGAERVFVTLANEFAKLSDAPVHLVLARGGGPYMSEVAPQVRLIDFAQARLVRSLPSLVRYLKHEQPQVLLATMNDANVVALLAWYIAGKPCRIVIRDAGMIRCNAAAAGRYRRAVLHWLMRRLYPRADAMVVIADDILRFLHRVGVTPCSERLFIGNPVTPGQVAEVEAPPWCQMLPADALLICATGRLVEVKGFDVLLDAFASLDDPRAHLAILGEGPLRDALLAQARALGVAERVHLPGFVTQPRAVLARGSLFVSSSRSEGFPNAVMDALATGTPIVATSCPGATRDILKQGELGMLVPPDDPQALAHAMARSLISPISTREARLARSQEFAPALIARRYLEEALHVSAPQPMANTTPAYGTEEEA